MPWFKKYGLRQMISVQVGFPGETYESLKESFDFIEEIKPDFTRIQIWFCDATTPVWRKRDKFALKGKAYGWSHYTMNAETAVELVVRSFMALENVTWVPDPGYNWVSFYANEKRGMSIERQKAFLKFFVAAAREKLLKPNLKEISPELLKNFKLSAQYDRPGEPDLSVVEPYSGERYVAAEEFWVNEFRNANRVAPALKAANSPSTANARSITAALSEKLSSSYGLDFQELMLACYGAWAAVALGEDQASVVVSVDDKEPFPVHYHAAPDSSFADFAARSSRKLDQSQPHRLYSFFILTNPLRMKEFGSECPAFNAGFLATNSHNVTMTNRLEHYPAVNQQIDVLLKLTSNTDGHTLELSCPTGRYSQEQVERIAEELMAALETLTIKSDLKLKNFTWNHTLAERRAAAASRQSADIAAAVEQTLRSA
jgi:uncharacterized protein YejL (UPF0352 family)